MGTRRVLPEIGKLDIKVNNIRPSLKDAAATSVSGREQAFIRRRQNIVAEFAQSRLEVPRQILIEFQSHTDTAVFQILSWDSSAA